MLRVTQEADLQRTFPGAVHHSIHLHRKQPGGFIGVVVFRTREELHRALSGVYVIKGRHLMCRPGVLENPLPLLPPPADDRAAATAPPSLLPPSIPAAALMHAAHHAPAPSASTMVRPR